jgi:hypothetical protein
VDLVLNALVGGSNNVGFFQPFKYMMPTILYFYTGVPKKAGESIALLFNYLCTKLNGCE